MLNIGTPCFVYTIGIDADLPGIDRALKIGIARDPESRLFGLQTGSPFKLSIKKTWKFNSDEDARDFERACHIEFRGENLRLEWFAVTVERVDRFFADYFKKEDIKKEVESVVVALRSKRIGEKDDAWMKPAISSQRQPTDLLKNDDAAVYIGKSRSWLNKARMTGTGPIYMKNGGSVRYQVRDLDIWLEANRRSAIYNFNNVVSV